MRRILKTELWKVFHNKMMVLALVLGTLLALADVAENAGVVARLTEGTLRAVAEGYGSGGHEGFSLFVQWMAINGVNFGSRNFYLIWPVLAALPFGWSYCQERRSGIYNQIVSRSGKRTYYLAKYLAVFVSGGAAIAIPVTANLLINALVCPYSLPELGITPIANGTFLSALYYTHPWIYGFIWCGMEFLWGGAAACFCFIFGSMFRYQVLVILGPFACFLALTAAYPTLVRATGIALSFAPLEMAEAATLNPKPEWLVFSEFGILLLSSFLIGYWQVTKREFA